MKTNPKIVVALQGLYFDERMAENQYLSHYAVVFNSGLPVLAAQMKERAADEAKHAERLAGRLAFFGFPANAYSGKIDEKLGSEMGIEPMLDAELPKELDAIAKYNAAISLCVELNDNDTRDLLVSNLKDETDHVHEIETAQGLIELIGVDNFAQAMM
ncbi:MAG: ferritin-like domain-containing protein [bacterium]